MLRGTATITTADICLAAWQSPRRGIVPRNASGVVRIGSIMARPPIHPKWSNAEDEVLKRHWAKPLSITAIAMRMRRSHDKVRLKAAVLGLPSKNHGNGGRKAAGS